MNLCGDRYDEPDGEQAERLREAGMKIAVSPKEQALSTWEGGWNGAGRSKRQGNLLRQFRIDERTRARRTPWTTSSWAGMRSG